MALTLPTPKFDLWNFADNAVAYDTTTNVQSLAELNAAIAAAMADGAPGSPKFHDIVWTAGPIPGNLQLTTAAALPAKDAVFIRIRPGVPYGAIDGEFQISSGVSNIMLVNWTMQPTSTDLSSGLKNCIRFQSAGAKFMGMKRNRLGHHWASRAVTNGFPQVIGGGNSMAPWEILFHDNEIRRVYQVFDGFAGYRDSRRNLLTDYVDDFYAMGVRGHASHISWTYSALNVMMDAWDDPATGQTYHPDYAQTGTPSDVAGDEFDLQTYGNIVIGDTYQTSPVQAVNLSKDAGASTRIEADIRDEIYLVNATRGVWPVDKRFRMERVLMAWPALEGPVPTAIATWTGGPYRQYLRASGNMAGGAGATPIYGPYIAGQAQDDNAGWGGLPAPVFVASPTAALGGATAYDQRFPNMAGLSFNGASLMIPRYLGNRTLQDVRDWVDFTYMPAGGWAANGFNAPADWDDAGGGWVAPRFGSSVLMRVTVP